MPTSGEISLKVEGQIAEISFEHPKANCLTKYLLEKIVQLIEEANNKQVGVIIVRSEGDGAFCSGASFEEFKQLADINEATLFFEAFASLILAVKNSAALVISRVHGKAVGGGVGLIAASDYALATEQSEIKLSEIELGIGPFVIAEAVKRKIGTARFGELAIDANWRSASWACSAGLYASLYSDVKALDAALLELSKKFANYSKPAVIEIKKLLWSKTEDWPELLKKRAEISGKLLVSSKSK